MHQQLVISEGTGIRKTPSLRRRERRRQRCRRLQQPGEGSAQEPGTESQLQLIHRILSQQRVRQDSTTKQDQPEPALGAQTLQRFAPAGRQPTTGLEARGRPITCRQQMAFKRLLKKGPLQRESSLTTHNKRCRLRRAPLKSTFVQQILITDQTAGVMGPQRSRSDQCCITPGERFFKNTTITRATQLGCTSRWRSQTTIKADGKHQTDLGALSR